MHARVVVADQSEVRFYDVDGPGGKLRLAGRLTDPIAHLYNRELVSDRPGRVFDHAPPAVGRRGCVARHGTGGERSPRKHEALSFARTIATQLETAQRAGEFDRLVLMAGPGFLGLLREVLPKSLLPMVAAEVNKDLVHQTEAAITEHLPREALT
jgi:protein required for attachment to host cells